MGIIDTIRFQWRAGSLLLRLIFVNAGVFIAMALLMLCSALFNSSVGMSVLSWLQLPSDLMVLLFRPWTVFTYMFVQTDIWHLIFNMLWLYWFGTIFLSFDNGRRLMALYLYGGLVGALLFVVGFAVLPGLSGNHAVLTGSSAAVMAVVVATSMRFPDYRLSLFLFGPVALRWIGLVTVGLCMLQGQLSAFPAHLGGILAGVAYSLLQNRGVDITRRFNRLIDSIVNLFRVSHKEAGRTGGVGNDRIDDIITKVKKSGYASLSDEEKRYLFRKK